MVYALDNIAEIQRIISVLLFNNNFKYLIYLFFNSNLEIHVISSNPIIKAILFLKYSPNIIPNIFPNCYCYNWSFYFVSSLVNNSSC